MSSLRLEDDVASCGKNKPCPKVWSDPDDPETVLVQGADAIARVRAEAEVPDDDVVARYPRAALLAWAARQLAEGGR